MFEILAKKISYISFDDQKTIQRAFEFAKKAHEGQKRKSGEPYITHCVATAEILAELKLDAPSIAAGLLHDTLEDTKTTETELKELFGEEITFLIKGTTKVSKLQYEAGKSSNENFRRLFLVMAEDIRVALIKLADRLHNMRTIKYHKPIDQRRIAQKTIEIYAPIANRLGISSIKGELEDLCFPILYPREYHWLTEQINHKYEERIAYLKRVETIIRDELIKAKVNIIQLDFRAKRYFSLYKKLQKYDMDFSKIYDLVAFRIIVPNIVDCYSALGAIHALWRPLPGRIKDYIAMPKPNGYKSIHTTVFCVDGVITEFQIRTPLMHQENELGVAAHWFRDEMQKEPHKQLSRRSKFAWVEQLREWQKENPGTKEFFNRLKIDFFKDRIFVFTPHGDVIDLPDGATPVDFAYRIHSDLGNQCVGAKINGKMGTINEPLQNSDVVEIIIQKNKKPSRNWLSFVKTSEARRRIKQALSITQVPKNMLAKRYQIKLTVQDRTGMVKDIANIFSQMNINIETLNTSKQKGETTLIVDAPIENKRQLNKLITHLKKIKGVIQITPLILN